MDTELFQCGVVDRGVRACARRSRTSRSTASNSSSMGIIGATCCRTRRRCWSPPRCGCRGRGRSARGRRRCAVEGVFGHAAEQLAGIEPDARSWALAVICVKASPSPSSPRSTLVPRVVGVGVIRAEHQLHQVLGLDALGGGVLVDGLERRAGEHATEVEQHRFDRRSHPPFLLYSLPWPRPVELSDLVEPGHTAVVTSEVQNGVIGDAAPLADLGAAARKEAVANIARLVRARGSSTCRWCTALRGRVPTSGA